MTTFKLPDLGEGLPEAEISEWYVKVGDVVKVDQPLVSMETAKAVVEVPSPQSGKITLLHGKVGDIIKTGAPLVEYEISEQASKAQRDQGTVVGKIDARAQSIEESFVVGAVKDKATPRIQATPNVRQLAKKLNVDLTAVSGSGLNGIITASDIEKAAQVQNSPVAGYQSLRGVRRQMAINMTAANQEVVRVTIFDDADIHQWPEQTDITVRIIQALIKAIEQQPLLNSWYDGQSQSILQHANLDLGIAMDTGDALFVPVIKDAQKLSAKQLRTQIDELKEGVRARSLAQNKLQGATFTLSNFGNFAGRYANPIIVPPTVAILGVGRIRDDVVAVHGEVKVHRQLPLSLSFDHRAVTGGEATRFLGHLISLLQEKA